MTWSVRPDRWGAGEREGELDGQELLHLQGPQKGLGLIPDRLPKLRRPQDQGRAAAIVLRGPPGRGLSALEALSGCGHLWCLPPRVTAAPAHA